MNKQLHFSEMSARLAAPGGDVWAVHYEALARKAAGDDVLVLSVGDPDFDTPPLIAEHVVRKLRAGRTHYSPAAGEDGLRQAIAELETRCTGKPFTPEQFVVFPGATAALYALVRCVLDRGDGLLVPEPMYVGYHSMFAALDADVQTVPLQPPNFELDVDALLARVQPNTRAVLVNTPGNPCGNLIPPETLARLAAECRRRNLWLICDEVYSLITFEEPHVSLLKCTDDMSNIAVVDGLSKSHAMTGWRVGWVVADEPLVQALVNLSGAAFFGVCQFVQDGAEFALRTDAEGVEHMRREYQRRRDYALERIAAIPGLECFRPRGSMFVMLDASALMPADTADPGAAFARRLLDEAGISTIPGSAFGDSARNYVRLSLTVDERELGEAFDRIDPLLN
ncbi:MAG: pyridoxal phosphate-dependent aminotransferase [Pseudomonadota bacterium]